MSVHVDNTNSYTHLHSTPHIHHTSPTPPPPPHNARCFGFDTAVQESQRALDAARVEASSAFRGVGIVKLMGRMSGFIAVQASLASGAVDVCLIPEVPFTLERLYAYVEEVLGKQGYCVICVAEGAGQVGGGEALFCIMWVCIVLFCIMLFCMAHE